MAEAFRKNAPDMQQFAGFLGLELWMNEDTLEAVSRWESREAMEAYSQSSAFRAHHGHGPEMQGPGAGAGGQHPHAQGNESAGGVEYFTGEVLI